MSGDENSVTLKSNKDSVAHMTFPGEGGKLVLHAPDDSEFMRIGVEVTEMNDPLHPDAVEIRIVMRLPEGAALQWLEDRTYAIVPLDEDEELDWWEGTPEY